LGATVVLSFKYDNGFAELVYIARAYDARGDDLPILLSPAKIYGLLEGVDIRL
jgi:hypothetical protein